MFLADRPTMVLLGVDPGPPVVEPGLDNLAADAELRYDNHRERDERSVPPQAHGDFRGIETAGCCR